ncbi:hypothetical protein F9817_15480 [Vibrio sp. CAIM 722]|uniref:Uncharacterized protein n=1 Tax=Vibrio eleionomae TaxID=2653505 RepID=A0A7X4LMG3_9VIBR|nr:hypothetical protein [Vibrio eleionomae]MZI94594.1 hypothetical protein [Vibrio eleionomae]
MMKDFVETMKLRGQAAENIYFSQVDKALIEELKRNPDVLTHRQQLIDMERELAKEPNIFE